MVNREERVKALKFLSEPRPDFVEIEVAITGSPDAVNVRNSHYDTRGRLVDDFGITWANPHNLNTEYGWGLSVIHDVKDHRFYGQGISHLTEFQTIVQTYYGRQAFFGNGTPLDNSWEFTILSAIEDELFGPRGPRVYGPKEIGLLDEFFPSMGEDERTLVRYHMVQVCFGIMLPPIAHAYRENSPLRNLQAPTTMQPELVDHYLPNLVWTDRDQRFLDIRHNIGHTIKARAYIDPELREMTRRISQDIQNYALDNHLEQFDPIFSTQHYVLEIPN